MEKEMIFKITCGIAVLIMLIYYIKRKNKLGSFMFGAFFGLSALFLLERFSDIFNISVTLNMFNICGSALLGIPFTALIFLLKYL